MFVPPPVSNLRTRSPQGGYRLVYRKDAGPTALRHLLKLLFDELFGYADFYEYQMWQRGGWLPVWQRSRPKSEAHPWELTVCERGYSVVLTRLPEFIAFDPRGSELLRVEENGRLHEGAWSTFFDYHGKRHFVRRLPGGQRLVLRLYPQPARLELDTDLVQACQAAEAASVAEFVRKRGQSLQGWWGLWLGRRLLRTQRLKTALALILEYRPPGALTLLRRLEGLGHWDRALSLHSLGPGGCLRVGLRPLVQQALRLLGEDPAPGPTYQFGHGMLEVAWKPLKVPLRPADRGQRLDRLPGQASPLEMLAWLGSPDFVRVGPNPPGLHVEHWEYDRLECGQTTLLCWHIDDLHAVELFSVETRESDWTERERLLVNSA